MAAGDSAFKAYYEPNNSLSTQASLSMPGIDYGGGAKGQMHGLFGGGGLRDLLDTIYSYKDKAAQAAFERQQEGASLDAQRQIDALKFSRNLQRRDAMGQTPAYLQPNPQLMATEQARNYLEGLRDPLADAGQNIMYGSTKFRNLPGAGQLSGTNLNRGMEIWAQLAGAGAAQTPGILDAMAKNNYYTALSNLPQIAK